MINSEILLTQIENQGVQTTLEEINEIIDSLNREDIFEVQKKRYSYEIWDKTTPINGVPADTIISSRPYAIDKAFLIYVDGSLLYFQDHNPNETGYVKMTKKKAESVAKEFIDKKANESTDLAIISRVMNKILKKG